MTTKPNVQVGDDFEVKLDHPLPWVTSLLTELAETHHAAFTCDMRGGFQSEVNRQRREFLEDALGIEDVAYNVCEYCHTFVLAANATHWPYPGTCPDCETELPPNLQSDAAQETVYLASSFSLADRVESVYDALTDAGFDIPDVWWRDDSLADQHPDAGKAAYYAHPEVHEMAERHYQTLRECDVFVLVAPADEPKKYNGANIEFGYALAHGAECYVVGAIERSAMYAPLTRVDSVDELLADLGENDG